MIRTLTALSLLSTLAACGADGPPAAGPDAPPATAPAMSTDAA